MDPDRLAAPTRLVPPRAPGTGGGPNPSPALPWPPLRAACMDLPPSLLLCHMLGTAQSPPEGWQSRVPLTLPRASSLHSPSPPSRELPAPEPGSLGLLCPQRVRGRGHAAGAGCCAVIGAAAQGGQPWAQDCGDPGQAGHGTSHTAWHTQKRGWPPVGGPQGGSQMSSWGTPHVLDFGSSKLGHLLETQTLGASAITVKGVALSTGWVPPDHWAE